MEGNWYLYDSSYPLRVCAGGNYNPSAIPGITVNGGVCGRMAELEMRKSNCMGLPATAAGEPGHCATFRFESMNASFTTLTLVSAGAGLCLTCNGGRRCNTAKADSATCTTFGYNAATRAFKVPSSDQCLDAYTSNNCGALGLQWERKPAVSCVWPHRVRVEHHVQAPCGDGVR